MTVALATPAEMRKTTEPRQLKTQVLKTGTWGTPSVVIGNLGKET
jgi:hypothetical protein